MLTKIFKMNKKIAKILASSMKINLEVQIQAYITNAKIPLP